MKQIDFYRTYSYNDSKDKRVEIRDFETIDLAKEDALNDLPIDLVSVSLHDAYNSVLEILGEYNQRDISKEIFITKKCK